MEGKRGAAEHFSSKVIDFEHFAQTSTITKLFIKAQI